MSASITAGPGASRSSSASTLRLLRRLHLYFGLFIAPALLFFAFTGAMQTLSLHEDADDSYHAPAWLESLGSLHKDQTLQRHHHDDGPPPAASPSAANPPAAVPTPPRHEDHEETLASKQKEHLPMKIFFLCVALGLFSSTFTGIYMAYKYERSAVLVTVLLLAGLVIPLLLLPF